MLSLFAYGLPVGDVLAARWRSRGEYLSWRARHLRHRHSRAWWRRHGTYAPRRGARALAGRRKRRRATAAASPSPGAAPRRRVAASKQRAANAALSVTNVAVSTRAPSAPAPTATNTSLPLVAPWPDVASASSYAPAPPAGPRKGMRRRQPNPLDGARPAAAPANARAPYELTLPASWSSAGATRGGEMKFSIRSLDGLAAGSAVLSPVAPVRADAPLTLRGRSLGGVPLAALRRTVIDLMVNEGGWVVNDLEREIRGRRVYVVLAQSGSPGGPQRQWTFYFTEVEGRLYRLATDAPLDLGETVAAGSERLVSTFRVGGQPQGVAAKSPEE